MVGALRPDWLNMVIERADKNRLKEERPEAEGDFIEVSSKLSRELLETDFTSSKLFGLTLAQRRRAEECS